MAAVPDLPDDVRGLRAEDAWWPKPPRPGPFRHVVGARTLPEEEWLRPREHDAPLLAWRRATLDAVGEAAFQVLPAAQGPAEELLALLAAVPGPAAAPREDGGTHQRPDGEGRHPLDRAGRTVVEDLLLIDVTGPEPVLVGGSLAMPNRWRLAEKLGRPMLGIHVPVPGYAQDVGSATDRVLTRLGPDRILTRSNWALNDRAVLFQPAEHSRVEAPLEVRTARDAARRLHVRVEYQTLRALPETGGVVFTIRTALEPLHALADRPAIAADLADTVERAPADHLVYKGVAPYKDPLLAYLREIAAG